MFFLGNQSIVVELINQHFFYLKSQHPLFSKIRNKQILHDGGMHYQGESKDLTMPLNKLKLTTFIGNDDVLNYNIESFSTMINKLSQNRLYSLEV